MARTSDGKVAYDPKDDWLVTRLNAAEAEVDRLTQRLRAQDEQQEMWTCSICDCTIRKEQMELGDGTPAPCPECGRIAAEMEVERLTRENERLRKVAAYVPARVYIEAQEKAGFPNFIRPCTGVAEAAEALESKGPTP